MSTHPTGARCAKKLRNHEDTIPATLALESVRPSGCTIKKNKTLNCSKKLRKTKGLVVNKIQGWQKCFFHSLGKFNPSWAGPKAHACAGYAPSELKIIENFNNTSNRFIKAKYK